METRQSQLNGTNRIVRISIGAALIGITMAATGPLGYLAYLPLLAIYPLVTGLVGEDPIDGVITNWLGGYQGRCFRPSTRVALLGVGVVAIGSVMGASEGAASLAIVAALSVYPILAGLFGEDLFSAGVSGLFRGWGEVQTPRAVVGIKHRLGTVAHHSVSFGSKHKAA